MTNPIIMIVAGVLAMLGGVLALLNPLAATVTAEQVAGWMFVLSGVVQAVGAYRARRLRERLWALVLAVVSVLLGIALLANPLAGIIALTLVVGTMFLVIGVVKIVASFGMRGTPVFWILLASGALSVVLALMIFGNFPQAAATILGILLAVELISTGAALIVFGSAARRPGAAA